MAYKRKPNKGMSKRFKVSATGKVMHRHEKSTHLRSRRSANLKRRLGRPGLLSETHAGNIRRYLTVSGTKPRRIAHERALAEKQPAAAEKK